MGRKLTDIDVLRTGDDSFLKREGAPKKGLKI